MINIFGSGADEHIELFIWLRTFHSPSTTTQLSGARSTTELIAHCIDLLRRRFATPRVKKTILFIFPFDNTIKGKNE